MGNDANVFTKELRAGNGQQAARRKKIPVIEADHFRVERGRCRALKYFEDQGREESECIEIRTLVYRESGLRDEFSQLPQAVPAVMAYVCIHRCIQNHESGHIDEQASAGPGNSIEFTNRGRIIFNVLQNIQREHIVNTGVFNLGNVTMGNIAFRRKVILRRDVGFNAMNLIRRDFDATAKRADTRAEVKYGSGASRVPPDQVNQELVVLMRIAHDLEIFTTGVLVKRDSIA